MTTSNATVSNPGIEVVTLDRRNSERRSGEAEVMDDDSVRQPRRKKQRRRHIDPTTCERDYNDQEIEFMRAMDDYKQSSGRMFPTCSEVLEVVRSLGYFQLDEQQIDHLGLSTVEEMAEGELEDTDEDLDAED